MEITFYKYQGTGNDFVIIDNRDNLFPKNNTKLVASLCDRRFGIGGDGLILLENDNFADFAMTYYNSDGKMSSMCGNGGRCIVAFAKHLNIIDSKTNFRAVDGMHFAQIETNGNVSLQMIDVQQVEVNPEFIFLDTGSPHHVEIAADLRNLDIKHAGAQIRYSELYGEAGANVNFVAPNPDGSFSVRTYERGVEDETLSCGTGVTAVAIAMYILGKAKSTQVVLHVEGGQLEVSFVEAGGKFTDIFLNGPATLVFKGTMKW